MIQKDFGKIHYDCLNDDFRGISKSFQELLKNKNVCYNNNEVEYEKGNNVICFNVFTDRM